MIEEKIKILQTIFKSNKITIEKLLNGYKNYYLNELANKKHVINSIPDCHLQFYLAIYYKN